MNTQEKIFSIWLLFRYLGRKLVWCDRMRVRTDSEQKKQPARRKWNA
jgi:hypothetical protein